MPIITVKIGRFGVDPAIIRQHGVVSGALRLSHGPWWPRNQRCGHRLRDSGIAGPGGGNKAKPVGTVWIAVASGVSTRLLSLRGDRARIQRRGGGGGFCSWPGGIFCVSLGLNGSAG